MPISPLAPRRSRPACISPVAALFAAAAIATAGPLVAQQPSNMFLDFVRAQAESLRSGDRAAATREAWEARRTTIRGELTKSWGGFPAEPAPLDSIKHGELKRDGYRVEKITFQTLPGVRMTANAYVPDRPGKLPAVLGVHGHWRGAKQDPVPQARCIGLAKLGFFVLMVDAFGAGERGVGKALGEYHGEMTGATLLPLGRPLAGIQVYENMRAVDYLRSRPEVNPERIGVTGASGGGNQSMYAGTFDERLGAAVPVCSVGNYRAYLGAACCMCEVVPGALRYTDEGDLLGLAAPRGLMVVSATGDAPQFSVGEAKKSLARAGEIFALYQKPEHVRHTIIESGHDYNRPMREAMYGWMTKLLKGEGDGSPIAEPEIKTEDPETLRCYPGETRPDDYVTIPKFAGAEARKLIAARSAPKSAGEWQTARTRLVETLERDVLGGTPPAGPLELKTRDVDGARETTFVAEPGITLTAVRTPAAGKSLADKPTRLAVVLDLDGMQKGPSAKLGSTLSAKGGSVVRLDLRATGALAVRGDLIGAAPDHNSAEWALWIGRPLLGQWTVDVRRTLDALAADLNGLPEEVAVVGAGDAGLVALTSAALDSRIKKVATVATLSSYVTDAPYRGHRLGILAPGILRDAGDVPVLAALVAPRPLLIVDAVNSVGAKLPAAELPKAYEFSRQAYQSVGASDRLRLASESDDWSAGL